MKKLRNIHSDVYVSLVIYLLVGVAWFFTTSFRNAEETASFARAVLIIIAALDCVVLYRGIRMSGPAKEDKAFNFKEMKIPLLSFLFFIVYEILFIKFGYFIATPVFLVAIMIFFGERNWKVIVPVVLGYLLIVYVIFVRILHIRLL